MNIAYIGIDVSKDTLSIDAGALGTRTIPNTPADIRKALKGIVRKAGDTPPHICFEATGPYTHALVKECCALPFSILNPYLVSQFAKSLGSAKTDPIDAGIIRRYAEVKRPEASPKPRESIARIRRLLTERNALTKSLVLFGAVVEGGAAKHARQAIKAVGRLVKKIDAEIDKAGEADEETAGLVDALDGVTGVGRLTAVIVAAQVPEIGTLGRRKAGKLAGLAPFTRQSGRWKGKAFIGGGRKDVRNALYMPAMVARRYNPDLQTLHTRPTAKGKPCKVAMTAVMRKLFCHLDAVARKHKAARAASGPTPSFLPSASPRTPISSPPVSPLQQPT
jgi:transposase